MAPTWLGPLSLEGEIQVEATQVVDGGVEEGSSVREFFSLAGRWSFKETGHPERGTLGWQFLHVNGERGGSADTGDLQGYTNLESPRSLDTLYELWWERDFLENQLRVKVGKMDANTEFAAVTAAGNFVHASGGFSPTLFPFPTYPESAFGLAAFYALPAGPSGTGTLSYGLFDGAAAVDGLPLGTRGPSTFFSSDLSDDWFHILEGTFQSEGYRFSLATWHHTGDFETFAGDLEEGTTGWVVVLEKSWGGTSSGRTTLFFQGGWADGSVSEVERHFSLGLIREGNIWGREADSMGLYYTWADLSDHRDAGFSKDEGALEVFYRYHLHPSFYIQPDLQWIDQPSGDPELDDALVANLRLGFLF